MKQVKKILVVLAVLAAVLLLGKNMIAKAALAGGVKMVTGLGAQVSGMQVGILKPVIGIQGLKILNPRGWPDPVMVSLKEFYVDYDLGALLTGKAHLRRLVLDLEEVTIIKKADNQVNIRQIKALQQKPAAEKAGEKKPAGKAPQLQIDALELRIGRVVFKDYTRTPESVKTFDLNINEKHEHIPNPYALTGIIVMRIMAKTGLAAITNIDVADLQAGVNEALKASTEQFNRALQGAQGMGQDVLKNTGEIISRPGEVAGEVGKTGQQAVGAAKDAAEAVKKLFR